MTAQGTGEQFVGAAEQPPLPAIDDQEAAGLEAAVRAIARGTPTTLDPCLVVDSPVQQVEGTRTRARVHFIRKDGNGRVMVNALADKLACRIVEYCIPRSRIDDAYEYQRTTGDGERVARLYREATTLFSSIANSGEGGELLLFSLLETLLGVPQILSKMSLKTSSQMHYHGVDGVHAMGLEDGRLAVYWGESKLYADVTQAITQCMDSLAPILTHEGEGGPLRDVLLVRDNLDAGSAELTARLAAYFNSDNSRATELEVRGACLVGFSNEDTDEYPDDPRTVAKELAASTYAAMRKWNGHLKKKMVDYSITDFEVEVFLLPFPSVSKFRRSMLLSLGLPVPDDAEV